jgi:non-heme chloroperoxidase
MSGSRKGQMTTRLFRFLALAGLTACLAHPQDVTGNWQGTLKTGGQSLRLILQVSKSNQGDWKAVLQVIDQEDFYSRFPASTVTLNASTLKLAVEAVSGAYEGTISSDGNSIHGTWTKDQPLPLDFHRVTDEKAWRDPYPHTIQFITVEPGVKLEVLDWGGSGRPIVLLAGLGNSAHIFDKFAPKLTAQYHVYGITRRGFGDSSAPDPSTPGAYSADRLGDDVLAVLDSLKLNRPVLVGHSIAGEELSSVGSRHPEKVAGLIYLDAAWPYAYYDRAHGDLNIDLIDLQKKLDELRPGKGTRDQKQLIQELLETNLALFERDLREQQTNLALMPGPQPIRTMPRISQAILAGEQKYTDIRARALAIYAIPKQTEVSFEDDAARAAFEARAQALSDAQVKAFETGVPSAKVVRLPHATHYVFLSNEADVLREMNAFLNSLKLSRD